MIIGRYVDRYRLVSEQILVRGSRCDERRSKGEGELRASKDE